MSVGCNAILSPGATVIVKDPGLIQDKVYFNLFCS